MKMHSALHLVCSVIPLGVTGGQIGYEKSRLDFNDPEKEINKEEIEEKLNSLVKDDYEITSEIIDSKIFEFLKYNREYERSKNTFSNLFDIIKKSRTKCPPI